MNDEVLIADASTELSEIRHTAADAISVACRLQEEKGALLEHRGRDLLSTTKLGRRLYPQGIMAVLTKS